LEIEEETPFPYTVGKRYNHVMSYEQLIEHENAVKDWLVSQLKKFDHDLEIKKE